MANVHGIASCCSMGIMGYFYSPRDINTPSPYNMTIAAVRGSSKTLRKNLVKQGYRWLFKYRGGHCGHYYIHVYGKGLELDNSGDDLKTTVTKTTSTAITRDTNGRFTKRKDAAKR